MKHRIGFHNPKEMQRPLQRKAGAFSFLTGKRGLTIEKLTGDCVWIFTRDLDKDPDGNFCYQLCGWFIIDDVKYIKPTSAGSRSSIFSTLIIGKKGCRFDPWLEMKGKDWFEDLLEVTNKFSLGFMETVLSNVIAGMIRESTAGEHTHPACQTKQQGIKK